ncbi:hypothetical protein EVAR_55966_1 [Eumeta japonica]|uniref:Uncharacterized protein n=1 Tax=Eumeta variegata TaxID=151549 RepID=A0A4C1YX05_EUMVA|nr:hypothetical protein EVAR_55966_1 [Eumeta japonica]
MAYCVWTPLTSVAANIKMVVVSRILMAKREQTSVETGCGLTDSTQATQIATIATSSQDNGARNRVTIVSGWKGNEVWRAGTISTIARLPDIRRACFTALYPRTPTTSRSPPHLEPSHRTCASLVTGPIFMGQYDAQHVSTSSPLSEKNQLFQKHRFHFGGRSRYGGHLEPSEKYGMVIFERERDGVAALCSEPSTIRIPLAHAEAPFGCQSVKIHTRYSLCKSDAPPDRSPPPDDHTGQALGSRQLTFAVHTVSPDGSRPLSTRAEPDCMSGHVGNDTWCLLITRSRSENRLMPIHEARFVAVIRRWGIAVHGERPWCRPRQRSRLCDLPRGETAAASTARCSIDVASRA